MPHQNYSKISRSRCKRLNENLFEGQILGSKCEKRCLRFEPASILLTEFEVPFGNVNWIFELRDRQ
jgi:hypothetical protein